MSAPTATLPKNRKPACAAVFSYMRVTDLIFGWSGATPAHEPVGRRQRVEEVDAEARAQQLVGGVEPGRARPYDGCARGHGSNWIACSGHVPEASSAASTWSTGTSID